MRAITKARHDHASIDMHRPGCKTLPVARTADALSILDPEEGRMPATRDMIAAGNKIVVQRLRQRQAHMRAAVDIAMDAVPAPNDETVKPAGPHLKNESPRLIVTEIVQPGERYPTGSREHTIVRGQIAHGASASGWTDG